MRNPWSPQRSLGQTDKEGHQRCQSLVWVGGWEGGRCADPNEQTEGFLPQDDKIDQ